MNTFRSGATLIALALLPPLSIGCALAADNAAKPEASIAFANHGGIWNWQADKEKGLWVQSNHRKWYYATFMGPCIGLNFANSVGFDTRPLGTFDRFSAVVVPGWGKCQVQSFEPSDGPPAKQRGSG